MIKLITLLSLLFASPALAVSGSSQVTEAKIGPHTSWQRNYVRNPSGFRNTTNISVSSAAVTRDTDAADRVDGISSLICDASAQNGYCEWTLDTLEEGDKTGNCEASIIYKGDASLYKLQIVSGSDVVGASQTLSNSTDWSNPITVNVPCGSTRAVRFTQTESGTGAAVNVARVRYGKATNIGTVAQATFYAGMQQVGASGCAYTENTSSGFTNFVSLGTGSGCNAWTTSGAASAVGTNDHRITLSSVPPGEYEVIISAAVSNSTAGACVFRLTDGTNNYSTNVLGVTAATDIPIVRFRMSRASASGSTTFTVQASDNHASSCGLGNGDPSTIMSWTFYRFPSSSETVYQANTTAWKVDANISGANPSLGTSSVSSYTGIENGSLTLTNNSGNGNIAAQIPCSSTNAPTGTTCSVGNESVGVSFTPPGGWTGDVLACASFTHTVSNGAGGAAEADFQIVETPNNAQTISQEGKTRVQSGNATASVNVSLPNRVCGNFTFSSGGQKTLRLMYEQTASGTVNSNILLADALASNGQRDIHWEVYPINQGVPAPVFIGSVTSNSSGAERVERATVNNTNGSSSIIRSSSSWITASTCSGNGVCTYNIASGTFSQVPSCVCTSGGTATSICATNSITTTSFLLATQAVSAGTVVNTNEPNVSIICMGAR